MKMPSMPQPAGFHEVMALLQFVADREGCAARLAELEEARLKILALHEGRILYENYEADLARAATLKAEAEALLAQTKATCEAREQASVSEANTRRERLEAEEASVRSALAAEEERLVDLKAHLAADQQACAATLAKLRADREALAVEASEVEALRAEYLEKAERLRSALT